MASYQHLLQHTPPHFESPAKVFAKLKSKVQREGTCANDGIYTRKDPMCNVKEKHGAEFKSPRKRSESTWMTGELKENQRFGSGNEAQALTISPISSPQKTFGYLYSDRSRKPAQAMPPVTERGHGCTPRKGAFLESKAVSQPLFLVNSKQIYKESPQVRVLDGFNVNSRTPVKIQSVENDCMLDKERAPLMSSASMFTPMRKRKWEQWEFSNFNSSTKGVSGEVISQPQEKKTSCAFSEGETHNNTCMEDLVHARGFPAGPSEMNHFTHEPMFTPRRSTAMKRCNVILDKIPPMSPAKMFAYMKKRERKEAGHVRSSTRDLVDNFHQSRDTPPSTVHNMGELEDVASTSVEESVVPDNQSRSELADSQSDTNPPEDIQIPAAPSQPVLLEDPLILTSPRVFIPKKYEAVFKRNNCPQPTKFPSESVTYLKRWFLRRNRKGLFVDGIHCEDNIPCNSNIIVDRVSNCVLKTVGRVFILVGKMNLQVESGFPKWFLKKFVNGFPPNWKELYEKFLSESRNRETERNSEGRGRMSKTKSEASSVNLSVKRHRTKPLKTPDARPPASSSSTKVSRSGRVIKPPLEYWKGGRVILDAHMNVTIHECYDTSICSPVTTTVSARASQKSARVFLPSNEDSEPCESTSDKETSVPLRKVKAPLRRRNRANVNHEERPSYSPEAAVETLSSPEEWSGRRTWSSQRCRAAERALHADTDPHKHVEKPSTWKSKNQKHDTKRPAVRVSGRKWAVPASPESPTVDGKISQDQSSKNGLSIRRTKWGKEVHRKRGEEEEQPGHLSEESGKELKKKNRDNKQSKCTKISQPPKPLPKSTQSSKRDKGNTLIPQEQDEDEWTGEELMRLKEAVAFYPKHMAGYWEKVARIVGTRSAEECHNQHTSQGTSQSPAKKAKKPKKKPLEAPKDPDNPVISARVGTFKRKQQVRQFLETMPRENVDDVFSCSYMQNKRFEIPMTYPSSLSDEFPLSDLEPVTPRSIGLPEVKTPQCQHITPGMMGSPNRGNDDKYVYQLQRRMKKSQFNVCKQAPSKSFTPTPSVKRIMKRCSTENDNFVVWEMFPGNDGALSESGEEEDFYFSDNDNDWI